MKTSLAAALGRWGFGTLAILAFGAGCAAQTEETEPTEENVGTVSQAFSGGFADWGVTQPSNLNLPEYPTSTHTCFLTGVFGNLDSHNDTVNVALRPSIGGTPQTWMLSVNPDSGSPLRGQAACVKNVINRTPEMTFFSGQGAKKLGAGEPEFPNRRCFLTAIRSRIHDASQPNDFADANDRLAVQQNSVTKDWYLIGSGRAAGSARCIDVTEDLGVGAYYGPGTWEIMDHASGRRCFLADVRGAFTANDFNNGVSVYLDDDSKKWKLKVSAGKFAAAWCAR